MEVIIIYFRRKIVASCVHVDIEKKMLNNFSHIVKRADVHSVGIYGIMPLALH